MKGVFTISIDHEFAWGYADRVIGSDQEKHIREECDIVRRLIDIFEKYSVPATWAIVGHLLVSHEVYGEDEIWYDKHGLIERVSKSPAGHEIGSHSFAHTVFDTMTHEEASEDIKKARQVHEQNNLPFNSFVFPRNKEKYLDVLRDEGLVCFRDGKNKSVLPGRLGRLLTYFFLDPETGVPEMTDSGLVRIPSSMLLLGRNGFRKSITSARMKRRAIRGLRKARDRNEVFHLWFHPSNFSYDTDIQFGILESIVKESSSMRDKGEIEVLTMKEVAKRV